MLSFLPPQGRRRPSRRSLLLALTTVGLLATGAQAQGLASWAVQPGYALETDSAGFELPTALAVVPSPGSAPDDPLYFVAELKGTIKVVTNDRGVHVFGTVPTLGTQDEGLGGSSQSGLAGLCLDAERGYLFATYTGPDEGGVLRNRIARFASEPGRFGLEAEEVRRMLPLLGEVQAAPAHQIGSCVVVGDRVFVGVGDGGNPSAAKDAATLLGKVLCLTVDGRPCPGNPFRRDREAGVSPSDYVYAVGFRNPFGLAWVEGELYAAENGVDLDRFLRVRRGADHLWRGTDQSLTVAADLVFTPTVSPVQLAYLPPGMASVDPAWHDRFLAAVFGGKGTNAGLVGFGSAVRERDLETLPSYLVEWVGEGPQHLAGVALGPDGVYFTPMIPGPDGGVVMKLRYDPARGHPETVLPRDGLESMTDLGALAAHGCVSCHSIEGRGGGIGPSLDRFGIRQRLTRRLNSPAYREQVERVDAIDAEPFTSWRDARHEVLAAEGLERTVVWLEHFLQEPRFDRPETQMPDLGLSREEALAVRADLLRATGLDRLTAGESAGLLERARGYAARNRRPLALGAIGGAGAVLGALLLVLLLALLLRRRA